MATLTYPTAFLTVLPAMLPYVSTTHMLVTTMTTTPDTNPETHSYNHCHSSYNDSHASYFANYLCYTPGDIWQRPPPHQQQ